MNFSCHVGSDPTDQEFFTSGSLVPTFVASVVIDAPVAEVFAFHERPDALGRLSPAFPPVRVVHRSGGIEAGAVVELRIGPVAWTARHTAYEKDRLFIDEQERGPFASWVHRHEFEDLGDGRTRLTDRVTYALPGGAVVNAAARPFATLALRQMFRHRHRVTKAVCEAGQR
jgi:ligand-binding SRPBCC domain-containing protein